ncbi:hypothetical protein [Cupriavidus plantarum]|uniref:hypothetical protein n=1 Tax=Cupriavidus plantarum TaxID=942865 RepID=UPI00339D9877
MTSAQRYTARAATVRACPLPIAIIEARASVFDPLNCLDLGLTARRVLFGILRFFNIARPSQAVWPRRDLLRAESLLNSESSLYRGLAELERCGYLQREQIRVSRNGRFHVSPVLLTEKARLLLRLNKRDKAEKPSEKVIHNAPSVKVEDGQYKEHTNRPQSLQKTVASEPVGKVDRATKVPVGLLWLLGRGLSPTAVFKLMGLAKTQGKRLDEVAQAFREKLHALPSREVFAYLRTMMGKDIDYRAVASQRQHVETIEATRRSCEAQLHSILEKWHGHGIVDRDGIFVGRLNSASAVVEAAHGSMPVNLRFARAVQEGYYRAIGFK